METAVSLTTGREYRADKVTYDQARKLKLVCCICREKVFKRIRTIPDECHHFVHHKGGSAECELYHPDSGAEQSHNNNDSQSHQQDFWRFIEAVRNDLETIALNAGIVSRPLVQEELARYRQRLALQTPVFLMRSSHEVEDAAQKLLKRNKLLALPEISNRLSLVSDFHRREQARFVDREVCLWALYSNRWYWFVLGAGFDRALERISTNPVLFTNLIAIFISALVCDYVGQSVEWVGAEFARWSDSAFGISNQKQVTAVLRYKCLNCGDVFPERVERCPKCHGFLGIQAPHSEFSRVEIISGATAVRPRESSGSKAGTHCPYCGGAVTFNLYSTTCPQCFRTLFNT